MKKLTSLKDLKYGNLNIEDIEFVSKEKPELDKLCQMFENQPYPDIEHAKKEIEIIKEVQVAYTKSPAKMTFCKDADEDLHETLTDLCSTINVDISPKLYSLDKTLGYMVVKLKQHYNRPRPYQVAYYTEQTFNPYETITGNSPAYPSGHALQGYFFCMYLAEQNPERKTELMTFSKMIAESRIALGVHYPSDNAFSEKIAKILMSHKETLIR